VSDAGLATDNRRMEQQAQPSDPPPPRRAATLVLLRDGAGGLEVLLLKRIERSNDRSSGAWVFPGGTLDAADAAQHACCAGLDDGQASARLGLDANGLDYYVAAVRECFEEAGVLLAHGDAAPAADEITALRRSLRDGSLAMHALCERLEVRLAVDRLAYHSHWLTPPGLPKRFDTRFFVAAMPAGQSVVPDRDEMVEQRWMRPGDALAAAAELRLPNPTRRTLRSIEGFATVADCLAHTHALRDIRRIMPRVADGPRGLQPVHPDEPAYAEIGRIDPHGAGHARYVIEPGHAVQLSPRVLRITAPNPGMMTGPGTNSYFVGDPAADAWALIDPGPADPSHLDALLAAAPGPLRWILVTHTHRDHSPAAMALGERSGAAVLGRPPPAGEGQDESFRPERAPRHGEVLALGPGAHLRVIHTPGHASNHLCYLLVEEKTLFTGDHVMQGSTVVINPPDGEMGAYLASLRSLLDEDLDWLAPGHGFLIGEPRAAIERLIAHRRAREAKVVAALSALGPAPIAVLLERVYDDVPSARHRVAERSLLAHLLELQQRGEAEPRGGDRWASIG
jgi:glyoxylase-like metal-dependent hydrolase (beta-lactamase superfamily II)/8-oxo-dGTP pyrophosphatase MutT (NUDIX family)